MIIIVFKEKCSDMFRVVGCKLIRIVDEVMGFVLDFVILDMPAHGKLFSGESVFSLLKYFQESMLLAPYRVMTEDEFDRVHISTFESDIMTTTGNQVDLQVKIFPGFHLMHIEFFCPLIIVKKFADIFAGHEGVVDRPEIQEFKVNGVISQAVNNINCFS